MEKELHKCLVDFFSKFENTDNKWQESRSNLVRVLNALENQAEQLRHVTNPEVDNAELFKVEGLRERLIFKIHAGIEEEVTRIQEAITRLHNNSQDLKNRLTKIESARNAVSLHDEKMKELVSGTPYRPKLNLLLEWAIDVCEYYHNLYPFMVFFFRFHDEWNRYNFLLVILQRCRKRDFRVRISLYPQAK
ncbi:hypothetical protein QAD02_019584 [Eretmocerus hayati]|uniref:Uncharacterized protein n=1 Tax=Eretmocerus hayati TaxID=131215 RepID=A0ACC2PK00_9HYME|nr:hypothetical protein QAD02_019584 [Eretmocerus hayati]